MPSGKSSSKWISSTSKASKSPPPNREAQRSSTPRSASTTASYSSAPQYRGVGIPSPVPPLPRHAPQAQRLAPRPLHRPLNREVQGAQLGGDAADFVRKQDVEGPVVVVGQVEPPRLIFARAPPTRCVQMRPMYCGPKGGAFDLVQPSETRMLTPPSGRSASKRQRYSSACHARLRHPKGPSGSGWSMGHFSLSAASHGEMSNARRPASVRTMRSRIFLFLAPSAR